ncbi:MAG: serine/threonine-protein kinase [Planctomycetota bacterium]
MSLKRRQRFGQYRIEARLATGAFAEVYRAYDTVEGIQVALKMPHAEHVDAETLTLFRREVRLVAKLDHPNILPIKTAGMIDGRFVIVTALAEENLAERMTRRIARKTVLGYIDQLLAGLAHAHRRKTAHLDVKPENVLVFPDNRLRLADFGLARVMERTLQASGSGTIGYLAPEQAMGKPALRSDVFAAGLVSWKLLSGALPEWPFEWPYPGAERVRRGYHPDLVRLLQRSLSVDQEKRFTTADAMHRAFGRIRDGALV